MKKPLLSPFCANLTSKKAYFNERPPQTAEDVVDGSAHCWCARTMMAIGPDSDLVGPEDCVQDRECFEPLG